MKGNKFSLILLYQQLFLSRYMILYPGALVLLRHYEKEQGNIIKLILSAES